jgi:hypothetical protein
MLADPVSRTVCRLACLYTFSLFFTAMALASVHIGGLRDAQPCGRGACEVLALETEMNLGLPAIWPARVVVSMARM